VVGETPVLIPGHGSFVYSSSAEIDTPTGFMQVRACEILRLKTSIHQGLAFHVQEAPSERRVKSKV